MPGRFLLDTNAVIGLLAGDADALRFLSRADEVFVSSIALGELYYGAYKSARAAENIRRIDELAGGTAFLICDAGSARRYGEIKDNLRAKGRPLPENDIWIAAVALQNALALASRDAHFLEIDGLTVEIW